MSSRDSHLEEPSLRSFPSCLFYSLLPRFVEYEGVPAATAVLMPKGFILFGGLTEPEFPSTESAIYLETSLALALLFISTGRFNLMLHLLWLTANTVLKSSPLNEE